MIVIVFDFVVYLKILHIIYTCSAYMYDDDVHRWLRNAFYNTAIHPQSNQSFFSSMFRRYLSFSPPLSQSFSLSLFRTLLLLSLWSGNITSTEHIEFYLFLSWWEIRQGNGQSKRHIGLNQFLATTDFMVKWKGEFEVGCLIQNFTVRTALKWNSTSLIHFAWLKFHVNFFSKHNDINRA